MRAVLPIAALLATSAVAGVARADAIVVVHVNGNVEGVTVRITDGSGSVHDCTTDATGECTVDGVAPGRVFVEAQSGPSAWGASAIILDDVKTAVIVPTPTPNPAPPAAPGAPEAPAPPSEPPSE